MVNDQKMLLKIAYENLWRRRSRTLIVIIMIAVGIAVLTFMSGLYDGMVSQMVNDTIYSDTCEITVFKKDYRLTSKLSDNITEPQKLTGILERHKELRAFFPRLKNDGMISSTRYSQGVKIFGIVPGQEEKVTNLRSSIRQGEYRLTPGKKEVIIGAELAEDLKVKPKQKVVIMGQAKDKSIASAAFRVSGIVRTNNTAIDRNAVFIELKDAQELFLLPNTVSQFSIVVKEPKELKNIKNALQNELGNNYEVFTWKELFKGLEVMQKMIDSYNAILYAIIFTVVAIGIFNIVLISVLERVREFGIMLAIGTKFSQLAKIIILESMLIGLLGFAAGSALGYLLLIYFKLFGLDLSNFSSSLEAFGMAAVMRPTVALKYFMMSATAVFITSFIASLWPIRILKKLKPVQSIRFI